MTIEQFVAQSSGKWRSMRSGHSLAFQQFEEVLSEVTIEAISKDDSAVKQLLESRTEEYERSMMDYGRVFQLVKSKLARERGLIF